MKIGTASFLLFLFSFLFSHLARAEYVEIPISTAVENWSQFYSKPNGPFGNGGYYSFKAPVCDAIQSEQAGRVGPVCKAVAESCKQRFGSGLCRAGADEAGKVSERFVRFMDGGLRREVFQTTSLFFHQALLSPYVQSFCCDTSRNPEACKRTFENTKLSIIDMDYYVELYGPLGQAKSQDNLGQYDRTTNSIRIAAGALLRQYHREGVIDFVLHELGHSCQNARADKSIGDYGSGLDAVDPLHLAPSQFAISVMHGQKVGDCIGRGLLNSFPNFWIDYLKARKKIGWPALPQKVIYGAWGREAFAEAFEYAVYGKFFMGPNRDLGLSLFAWDCDASTDDMHGPTRVVMECLLDDAQTRDAWCPAF